MTNYARIITVLFKKQKESKRYTGRAIYRGGRQWVTNGVPHGSVLGRVSFLVYVNNVLLANTEYLEVYLLLMIPP